MAWYWYVVLALVIYVGGIATGGLMWRNNAIRFKALEGRGKQALVDLTGTGRAPGSDAKGK